MWSCSNNSHNDQTAIQRRSASAHVIPRELTCVKPDRSLHVRTQAVQVLPWDRFWCLSTSWNARKCSCNGCFPALRSHDSMLHETWASTSFRQPQHSMIPGGNNTQVARSPIIHPCKYSRPFLPIGRKDPILEVAVLPTFVSPLNLEPCTLPLYLASPRCCCF